MANPVLKVKTNPQAKAAETSMPKTAPDNRGKEITGAEILWEALGLQGVEVVFGYPGGAIMPAYDAMLKYPIRHVLVRHEQGAAHMADGYARASGKVGVCVATSGPGATNLVTGIATAMLDSIPMVAITGQVPSTLLGTDAFQETDITGVTLPITKHNYLVTKAEDIAPTIREAFHVASTGRPGPVVIDITKDAQQSRAVLEWDEEPVQLPGHRPQYQPVPTAIDNAIALINSAERPVILAGHGITQSGATETLLKFVEQTDIPATTFFVGFAYAVSWAFGSYHAHVHVTWWLNLTKTNVEPMGKH